MRNRWLVVELLAWYLLLGISVANAWLVMWLLLVTCVPAFWTGRFMAYRLEMQKALAEWQKKLKEEQ